MLIQRAVWPQHTLAENWRAVAVWGWGAGSVPSFILIHPTAWPQYITVTNRPYSQSGQDRQTTDRWHRANRYANGRPQKIDNAGSINRRSDSGRAGTTRTIDKLTPWLTSYRAMKSNRTLIVLLDRIARELTTGIPRSYVDDVIK